MLKQLSLSLLFIALALLHASCSRGGGTIRHGDLSYNAEDVFEGQPATLELAKAAGRGDAEEVRRLISKGASPNTFGKNEITPLWWAIWVGNYDGFNALLENGADPNALRSAGLPIVHLAARNEDVRFLTAVIKHGGHPDTKDHFSGQTPLFITITFDLQEQTALLLKAGANVNAQQPYSGWTLPMQAIGSNGNYRLVYELLQRGADYSLKATNGKGTTLADVISTSAINPNGDQYLWREKVMEYLRSKGIKVARPERESPRTKP